MKTKVGEYKGKVIVEGGENPENELKPWEMLFPDSQKKKSERYVFMYGERGTTHVSILKDDSYTYCVIYDEAFVNEDNPHGVLWESEQEVMDFASQWEIYDDPKYADGSYLDIKHALVACSIPSTYPSIIKFSICTESQYNAIYNNATKRIANSADRTRFLIVGIKSTDVD